MNHLSEEIYQELKESSLSGEDIYESEITANALQTVTGKSYAQVNCDLTQLKLYQRIFNELMANKKIVRDDDICETVQDVIHESLRTKMIGRTEAQKQSILLGMYQRVSVLLGKAPSQEEMTALAGQELFFLQEIVEKRIVGLTMNLLEEYKKPDVLKIKDPLPDEIKFSEEAETIRNIGEHADVKNVLEMASMESFTAKTVLKNAKGHTKAEIVMMVLADIAILIGIVVAIYLFFAAAESGQVIVGSQAIRNLLTSILASAKEAIDIYGFSIKPICYIAAVSGWSYLSEDFWNEQKELETKHNSEAALSAAAYEMADDLYKKADNDEGQSEQSETVAPEEEDTSEDEEADAEEYQ